MPVGNTDATLDRCVIGIRSIIESGALLKNVVMMGADYYESQSTPPPGANRGGSAGN